MSVTPRFLLYFKSEEFLIVRKYMPVAEGDMSIEKNREKNDFLK